jgi:hypothetical protein
MMEPDPLAEVPLGGGADRWRGAEGSSAGAANPGKINGKNIERGLTRERNRRILAIVNSREGNDDRMSDRSGW